MKAHMSRKSKAAAILGTLGLLTLGTIGTAYADGCGAAYADGGSRQAKTKNGVFGTVTAKSATGLHGTIKSADLTAKSILVATDDNKEVTLKVTEATKVNVQGLMFDVLGLTAGMTIEARYDMATNVASMIRAHMARPEKPEVVKPVVATGVVTGVNAAANELTLTLESRGSITLKVDAKSKIEVNGKVGTLADVKAGDRGRVEFLADTKLVLAMSVKTSKPVQTPRVTAFVTATGALKTLDTVTKTVVVTTANGDVTLTLTPETKINAVITALANKVGAKVRVEYNLETKVVVSINPATTRGPGTT